MTIPRLMKPRPNPSPRKRAVSSTPVEVTVSTATRRVDWTYTQEGKDNKYGAEIALSWDLIKKYICENYSRPEEVYLSTEPSPTNRYAVLKVREYKQERSSITGLLYWPPLPKNWHKLRWQENQHARLEPKVGYRFDFMDSDPNTKLVLFPREGIIHWYYPPALRILGTKHLKGPSKIEQLIRGELKKDD